MIIMEDVTKNQILLGLKFYKLDDIRKKNTTFWIKKNIYNEVKI